MLSKIKSFIRKALNKAFRPVEESLAHQLRVSLEESNRLIEKNIDNSIRQYLAPLLSSSISTELGNINLLVERMAKLYHPVFLNSFSDNDSENYQKKILDFLKKLKITLEGIESATLNIKDRRYIFIRQELKKGLHVFLGNDVMESPDGKFWVINETLDVLGRQKMLSHYVEDADGGVLVVDSDLLAGVLNANKLTNLYPRQIVLVIERMERISSGSFLQSLNNTIDSLKTIYSIHHVGSSNLDGIVSVYNFPVPRTLKLSFIRSDSVDSYRSGLQYAILDDRDDLAAPNIYFQLP